MDEFITLYYGEQAVDTIKDLIQGYEEHTLNLMSQKSFSYNCFETALYSYENQPLNLHLSMLENLNDCIEKYEVSAIANKEFYIENLKEVKLTPLFTILMNSTYYFMGDEQAKGYYVNEFFNLCNELGVKQYGENLTIQSLKSTYAAYIK